MLLCQLLKSDKLSIFSTASQKATNSLATKLLISTVFPLPVSLFERRHSVYSKYTEADIPLWLHGVIFFFQPTFSSLIIVK